MEDLKAIIESLLFVADKPMGVEKLAEIIEETDTRAIRATLKELLNEFDNPGRGFRLHEVAGGYQFRTHPECQAYIRRMLKPAPSRLSRAALETLSIIAYKQPIIRSDIEHIRGVDSGGVLRVLMEKKLIRVLGRREIPGRPLIYATTKHFLEVFDLKNLGDLPTPKEIEELTSQEPDLEEPSEEDNLSPNPPEVAATTTEGEKQADAQKLGDGRGGGRENQPLDKAVPVVETPTPSEAPEIDTTKSDTPVADEAPEETSNKVTHGIKERPDGETIVGVDVVADEVPDDVSDDVSDEASTVKASIVEASPDEASDAALDQNSLGQNEDDRPVDDDGKTAD
jgi:segregation and condensation protein B